MKRPYLAALGALLFIGSILLPGAARIDAGAQGPGAPRAAAGSSYTPPRTPWGHPDLQGTYTTTNENGVPMERPDQLPAQGSLTDEEFTRIIDERLERARAGAGRIGGAQTGAGPPHWYEHLEAQNTQLWLISDPADGKLPPMTPDGQRRFEAARAARVPEPTRFEHFTLYDRCITRGLVGSVLPVIYGNSLDIAQAPAHVVIRHEMIHEARIVPLDDRPRLDDRIRQYMGDARGRWDGNTLVVETTNFTGRTQIGVNGNGPPHTEQLRVVERFTPIDADTLRWDVTIDDPGTWTRPWAFGLPLAKDPEQPVFEYACHEGNYALRNMLAGALAEEATRAAPGR